jgi:4-carboxymuconolactone decarboxylase
VLSSLLVPGAIGLPGSEAQEQDRGGAMEDLYAALRARAATGWSRANVFPFPHGYPPGSYGDVSTSFVFGDIWNRTQLSVRERRIAKLAVLAGFARDDITRYHVRSALELGDLNPEDLDELALTLACYMGFPLASTFLLLVEEEVARFRTAPDEGDVSAS